MTQNEIIEMAKEIAVQYGKAERFQTWTHDFMMQRLMELVNRAVEAEREACAKMLEDASGTGRIVSCTSAAKSIRARGEQDWDALAEKKLASIKRDTKASFEDAVVRATHKVMAEFETQPEQEPVALPCCGYMDASAVKWNPLNGVVQCHNCGQTYTHSPQRTETTTCERCKQLEQQA
jgi:hypothetical protein